MPTPKKTHATPRPATPYPTDLDYLQAELDWVEARFRRLVAERALRRSSGEPHTSPWADMEDDDLPNPRVLPRTIQRHRKQEDAARRSIDERLGAGAAAGQVSALERIAATYALDELERCALLLAAGPCVSRRFEKLFGDLEGTRHGSVLSVELLFEFSELSLAERVRRRGSFGPGSALVSNDLVTLGMNHRCASPEDLLQAQISLTGRTFDLLLGDDALGDELAEFSSLEQPRANFDRVVLPAADKARILSVVERHDDYLRCRREWGFDDVIQYGRGVLMLFHGVPGTGKTMTAHAVAEHLGKRVLNVDIPTFAGSRDSDRFLPALFREARIQNAVLFFDECETLFESRRNGNTLMSLLLTEIERFEGVAILATNRVDELDEALDRRILVKIRFAEPDAEARRAIWVKHLPPQAPVSADVDLDSLARRYEMTGGYIKNAVLLAVADVVHEGASEPSIGMDHLERAADAQMRRPQDSESGVLMRPETRLADVILPRDLSRRVHEFVGAERSRRTVFDRWGVGPRLASGRGLAALFFGDPGTGKTLCAEAIAGELNRPLLRATTAGLKSKWVGETERRLQGLFDDARDHGAVLLLDEADSLLMSRGAGHASRHDDAAVNVLLDLLERHDGVTILATNRPHVLDRALDRRISWRLEFPFPDEDAREAIWRGLLPETVPTDGQIRFDRLAARHPLSGGRIRNAVFRACFRAATAGAPLSEDLLDEAAGEEADASVLPALVAGAPGLHG